MTETDFWPVKSKILNCVAILAQSASNRTRYRSSCLTHAGCHHRLRHHQESIKFPHHYTTSSYTRHRHHPRGHHPANQNIQQNQRSYHHIQQNHHRQYHHRTSGPVGYHQLVRQLTTSSPRNRYLKASSSALRARIVMVEKTPKKHTYLFNEVNA